MLSTLLKDNVIDDGLMWMSRVIKKNFKPIRHPNATNVDDHEEGNNFISIDQVETDQTGDCDGQRRKDVLLLLISK